MELNNSVNNTDPCFDTTVHIESEISNWLWKIIGPIIFLIGVTGNILVLWVLKRLRFTSSSTLVHLFVLAMADTSVLCAGLTRYWINVTFQYDIRQTSDFGCKFHLYFTYTAMDFSAWVLVSVTAERVVCVYFPLHVKSWCTVRRACWRLFATYILLSLINCHLLWTFGLEKDEDGIYCQLVDERMHFYDRYVFVYVDLCFVSLMPFAIMLICNIFIVRTLNRGELFSLKWHHSRQTRGSNANNVINKNTATTRLLLIVTTFFACSTLPASLVYIVESIVKRDCDWKTHAQLELAWTITYLLQFSNYAVNFILYTTRNQKFRREVLILFHLRKARPHSPSRRTTSSSLSLQNSYNNTACSSSDRNHRNLLHDKEPLEDPSSDEGREDFIHVSRNINTSQLTESRENKHTHATRNINTSQLTESRENKHTHATPNNDNMEISLINLKHHSERLHGENIEIYTSNHSDLSCKNLNTLKNSIHAGNATHPYVDSETVTDCRLTSVSWYSDKGSELPTSGNLSDKGFVSKESAGCRELYEIHRPLTEEIIATNCVHKYTDGLEKYDGDSFNTYL